MEQQNKQKHVQKQFAEGECKEKALTEETSEDTNQWHNKVLSYKHLVRRWTAYFWGINKAFLYSYEDLEQTIWYILMVGLQEFDGRGDEEQFLNWYIRNKVVSIMMYGKKPPKCTHLPFTPIRFDYKTPNNPTKNKKLLYSHKEDD